MRWPEREREQRERNERGTRRSESATEGGRAEEERKAPRELKYYARRPRVVGKATGKDGSRGNKRVRPMEGEWSADGDSAEKGAK